MKIVLDINSCRACPFFKTESQWASGGRHRMEDWLCTKINRKIQGGVEWHEEKVLKYPNGVRHQWIDIY